MEYTRIKTGDLVQIKAADEFYAFVNGWIGRVTGWQAGCAEVVCDRPDGEKLFYVPLDQLIIAE